MRYFMSIFPPADLKPEEISSNLMDAMGVWIEKNTASGKLVTTNGLGDPNRGRRLSGNSGAPVVTDGPFAESKEIIGGYAIFEVDGLDAATRLAEEFLQIHIDNGIAKLMLELREIDGGGDE